MLEIRPYRLRDEEEVIRLWRDCGLVRDSNDPHRDIGRKLAVQPELFLVGFEGGQLVASVMAGYDGHRGWLNYLAVAPDYRHHGYGQEMVCAAENRLRHLGCPKINLQVRLTNSQAIDFYRTLGFQMEEVASMGKRLVED